MGLLFVCTGNICRSAAADRLMTAWTAGLPGSRPAVRSAGTRATTGRRMHPWTQAALQRHGVSAGGFTARRLSGEDIDRADLVLTMTVGHRDEVLAVAPGALRKVFTLREAAALAGLLPPGCLDGALPGDQVARLASALAEARALRRGALCDLDVADPIEGPAGAHAAAVHAVADSLVPLMGALEARPLTEETVRITRLPPFRCSRGTADHLLSRGRQPPAQRRRA